MSYDSNPNLYNFKPPPNNCILCHPVNESPDQIQIAVSGIKQGDLWNPGDPPPANGVFEITATGPCQWGAVVGLYTITLNMAPLLSLLNITSAGPLSHFNKLWTLNCNIWYPNTQLNPAIHSYYNGFASLAFPQTGVPDGVPELMDLVGIPASSGTAVSPRPMSATQSVYVFARNSDASNIHVKLTHT